MINPENEEIQIINFAAQETNMDDLISENMILFFFIIDEL